MWSRGEDGTPAASTLNVQSCGTDSPELGFHANVFLLEILKASCDFVKGGILATDFKFLSVKIFVCLVGCFETRSLYIAPAILEDVIAGIHRSQKMLDPRDVELQNAVSHPSWVLGTKLRPSVKAVLNYLSLQAQHLEFLRLRLSSWRTKTANLPRSPPWSPRI